MYKAIIVNILTKVYLNLFIQLFNDLGVSLGKVNYFLKSLVGKDFIKINNFRNSNKIKYSYLLTPKGIEEQASLTLNFIRIKTQEYNALK